jgi:hypothetical protein
MFLISKRPPNVGICFSHNVYAVNSAVNVCLWQSINCRGEVAFKWQAAAFAKRRADEADVRPAFAAHESVARLRAVTLAKLADWRIQQVQAIPQHLNHAGNLFPSVATGSKIGEKVLVAAARFLC